MSNYVDSFNSFDSPLLDHPGYSSYQNEVSDPVRQIQIRMVLIFGLVLMVASAQNIDPYRNTYAVVNESTVATNGTTGIIDTDCQAWNNVVALNAVGLRRRADLTPKDRQEVKDAFKITYRSEYSLKQALDVMNQNKDWGAAADSFRNFLGNVLKAEPPFNRGLCSHLSRSGQRRG